MVTYTKLLVDSLYTKQKNSTRYTIHYQLRATQEEGELYMATTVVFFTEVGMELFLAVNSRLQ